MTTESWYGNGMAWPVTLGAGGGVRESAGVERIEAAIRIVLGTQRGERPRRPTFGSDLGRLVFSAADAATANLARVYVQAALTEWEPRIDVLSVTVTPEPEQAALMIAIGYRIRATGQANSMVYALRLEQP